MNNIQLLFPGIGLCAVIGLAANGLAAFLPIGAVSLAILIGMMLGNVLRLDNGFASGITFSEKRILSLAIALMGVNLNYIILRELGIKSLVLIITAIGVTIAVSLFLASVMGVNRRLALLLGIGNGVCGTSAIAATEGIIGADEEEVGLSVAIVNFLGVVGMLFLPVLATVLLRFPDIQSGVLIGNTLQAVGQVTAAGFAVSDVAGQTAAIVKMGRILMLTPLLLLLVSAMSRQTSAILSNEEEGEIERPGVPLFILGFLLFSLLATAGWLPENVIGILDMISRYALLIAMAGIGLKITFDSILRDGKSALAIGSIIFLWQIVYSASFIYFLF